MTKMDALNQQTVMRFFRALKDYNLELLEDREALVKRLHEIQSDYMDSMIDIMEETLSE